MRQHLVLAAFLGVVLMTAAATTAKAQGFVSIGGPGFGVSAGSGYGGYGYGYGYPGYGYGLGYPAYGVGAYPVPVARPVPVPVPVPAYGAYRPYGYPGFYGPRPYPYAYGGYRPFYGPGYYRRW